jgi:hypothetical protein
VSPGSAHPQIHVQYIDHPNLASRILVPHQRKGFLYRLKDLPRAGINLVPARENVYPLSFKSLQLDIFRVGIMTWSVACEEIFSYTIYNII